MVHKEWIHGPDHQVSDGTKFGSKLDENSCPEVLKFIFCLFFGFDEIIFQFGENFIKIREIIRHSFQMDSDFFRNVNLTRPSASCFRRSGDWTVQSGDLTVKGSDGRSGRSLC